MPTSEDNTNASVSAIVTVVGISALFLVFLYCLVLVSKDWKSVVQERLIKALKRRRNDKDPFRKEYGYSWDYFMAFRVYDEDEQVSPLQQTYSLMQILDQLAVGGLEIRMFYSLQRKEIFVKIRAPLYRLLRHADLIDYKLLYDSKALQEECEKGREEKWEPLKIPINSNLTHLSPYEFIYGAYEFDSEISHTRSDLLPLYKRWPRMTPEAALLAEGLDLASIAPSRTLSTAPPGIMNNTGINNPLVRSNQSTTSSTVDEGLAMSILNPSAAKELASQLSAQLTTQDESSILRGVDRLKLIHQIISYHGDGGCHLDPYQLLKDECLLAYGPLHDMVFLRDLEKDWLVMFAMPWQQPFDRIKDYFGEKIGLYFLWLGDYTTWLIPAAIVGFIFWLTVAADENNPSTPSVPYFAGFISLWSALFLEYWKRKEKRTALRWGMIGYEEEEQTRPQFKGETILSPVTGRPTKYYSSYDRSKRQLFSQAIVGLMVLIVIAVVAVIFAIRVAIQDSGFTVGGADMSGVIASILLALQIQFLNAYFGDMALRLNNQENHRTDTEYEDALISKTFAFQFVNSFASLFYIGFVKPFIQEADPCGLRGCMGDLQTTLSTIFLTRLLMGNITEVGIPLFSAWIEKKKRKNISRQHDEKVRQKSMRFNQLQANHTNSSGAPRPSSPNIEFSAVYNQEDPLAKTEMSEVEKTFIMPEYHVMLGTFDDYAEMVIQFGYTTLFVTAFPLATVMSLINNYVEIRVDAWKLCHICRRPEPRSVEDIGSWFMILELTSIASILVNSALVAFTAKVAINYRWVERAWIFILMSFGLMCIRFLVGYLVPDVPEDVQIQLDRQEFLNDKVVDDRPDDDDGVFSKGNFEVPNFLVGHTDDDPM